MASQQKLGLRTERRSGIGRADHRHPAAHGSHLIRLKTCSLRGSQRFVEQKMCRARSAKACEWRYVPRAQAAWNDMDKAFNEASREF